MDRRTLNENFSQLLTMCQKMMKEFNGALTVYSNNSKQVEPAHLYDWYAFLDIYHRCHLDGMIDNKEVEKQYYAFRARVENTLMQE